MKFTLFSVIMLAIAALVLPVSAETFVLKDGKQIEGTILRTNAGKVTLKTAGGVSTYNIMQFDEKTRGEHFRDFETAPVKREAKQTESRQSPATDSTFLGVAKPKVAMGLMIVGAILCIIGSLWFIIAGFAESVGWGIALILFNGIAGLAFLILHWDRAKSPVLTYLIGIGLVIAATLIGQ